MPSKRSASAREQPLFDVTSAGTRTVLPLERSGDRASLPGCLATGFRVESKHGGSVRATLPPCDPVKGESPRCLTLRNNANLFQFHNSVKLQSVKLIHGMLLLPRGLIIVKPVDLHAYTALISFHARRKWNYTAEKLCNRCTCYENQVS